MGFRRPKIGARDDEVTNAANLTLRQSILPLSLVTVRSITPIHFVSCN